MPSRGPVLDPFKLREDSQKIPNSISIPLGYLRELRRYAERNNITVSSVFLDAIETHAKTIGVELPRVTR